MVGILVARLLAGSSLGSNPDISEKYKMGDISKGVANTLQPAKKTNIFCILKNSMQAVVAFILAMPLTGYHEATTIVMLKLRHW
jgi:hypothetical protein